ncbi:type VI secretion system tube protein TssD [Hymenobacter weizhouensis]|uniref:type VI secretion system tube protein TssD n=1 Tax=Hymenobacter sp. YIM 151500-1 TaxID=2987689 RepID=UPI00222605DF|nr:type VI secretion system tube protein TssD [Hymenobacter sp. YIM 151500-1]UYZ62001.1 hypothetical protein OIS53_13425 [Hymenobacter sp. YIM 151500-1]
MPTPVLDAELQVARHRVLCTTTRQGLRQKTDFAGRRSTRVRSHPIEVTITGEAACWSIWDELAADSVRRESGHLVWRTAQGQVVRHLVFYDAYCTRLGFRFDARGQQGQPSLELTLRFSPAAIELNGQYTEFYSRLPWEKDPRVRRRALIQPPPLLPPHLPPLPPRTIPPAAAAAAAEEAAGLLGGAALRAASTVLGTLALVLTPANDADAPGYDAEKSFQKNHPPNLDAIRLAELEREREYRALSQQEEAEYVALLAKVKGVRVQSVADLDVIGRYKKQPQGLPGFHFENITYTKRSKADTDALRRKFASSIRPKFLKKISNDPMYVAELRKAGFDDQALKIMQGGNVPTGWQVHHKLPLDDGGDNSFNNLLLIKNTPYHSAVTGYQKTNTGHLTPGQSVIIKWPTYSRGIVYPSTQP